MADRRAVLIPGQAYDTQAPLFAYIGEALRRSDFDLHEISWQVPETLGQDQIGAWVAEQVAPSLAEPTDLVVGKSLGSLAAPLAAERQVPAVWLTPLLQMPGVVTALERASEPFLLIGGGADPLWDGPLASRLTRHVLEILDADHSLLVPGPMAASADALGRVCTAVEEFVRITSV
ncbi:alpha/beta hydrolase [Micromonospora sp. NPDC048909]|uniref:alpha/beta hydrolase n=1 Tax=Micromonospora sp. NPDC048909 TaxID=3155643 RepID=UPI003402C4FF